MKNSLKLIVVGSLVMASASCGLSRKSKQKQSHQLDEISKKDSLDRSFLAESAAIKEQKVDRDYLVTERETTTTTAKAAKRVEAKINKSDLRHGNNFLQDRDGLLVNVLLDTVVGTLAVQFDYPGETTTTVEKEKTTAYKDETANREESRQEMQQKEIVTKVDQRKVEKSSSMLSESKPDYWAVFLGKFGAWLGVAIAFIIVAWWFFGFRKKKVSS